MAGRRSREQLDALVLRHLAGADSPLSAYDIATRAAAAGDAIVPNQVYRTLARLIGEGRVYRLESLSAYVLKSHEADACLICDACHRVRMIERPDLVEDLGRCARDCAFSVATTVIEVHGRCADCAVPRADEPVHLPS